PARSQPDSPAPSRRRSAPPGSSRGRRSGWRPASSPSQRQRAAIDDLRLAVAGDERADAPGLVAGLLEGVDDVAGMFLVDDGHEAEAAIEGAQHLRRRDA